VLFGRITRRHAGPIDKVGKNNFVALDGQAIHRRQDVLVMRRARQTLALLGAASILVTDPFGLGRAPAEHSPLPIGAAASILVTDPDGTRHYEPAVPGLVVARGTRVDGRCVLPPREEAYDERPGLPRFVIHVVVDHRDCVQRVHSVEKIEEKEPGHEPQ
jgi:hypothetical protein